jgi:hypothetical protein
MQPEGSSGWLEVARAERKVRNLRDPFCHSAKRKSEGLIVAMKDLTHLERRGPTVNMQPSKPYATA